MDFYRALIGALYKPLASYKVLIGVFLQSADCCVKDLHVQVAEEGFIISSFLK